MHIVIIAWLWVVLMMALTAGSMVAGILTFVCFGLAPCTLLFWLGAQSIRRRRARSVQRQAGSVREQALDQPDRPDA